MAKKFYGGIDIQSASSLAFYDSDSSAAVSLKSQATVASSFTVQLPAAQSAADDVMLSSSIGVLAFGKIANANVAAGAAIAYSKLALSDSIVNADINSAAAIAYSKLALSNSIVNADINASAAIAYSKLALSNSIVNADIAAAAAIAYSKLAALTASRALVSDGSGFVSVSAVTSTELGYVSGVTSAIQTQIDGKVAKAGDTMTGNLVLDNQSELRLSELDANGSEYAAIKAPAALTASYTLTLPADAGTSGYVLSTNGSGVLSWVDNGSVTSFKADWALADGTSKTITHNLGSLDVMVQIYDKANGASIEVNSVVRTDTNTLDLTASEAPNASGWRVMIFKV